MGGLRTLASPLATEATSASDEDRGLVLEDEFARGLVSRLDDRGHRRGLALVEDFEQLHVVCQRCAGWDSLLDSKELFAVKEFSLSDLR